MVRLGKTFFGEYGGNWVYYETSVLKHRLNVFLGDIRERTKILCNKNYYKYVRLPLVFSTPFNLLVWRVAWVKLLMKNATFTHSASVKRREDAFMILGFSNTGKTTTTLQLLMKNDDLQYLSDDASIIDIHGFAYSNFTRISALTLERMGFRIPLKSKLISRLEVLIPPSITYFHRPLKSSSLDVEKILGNSRIGEKARIRAIIFLERSAQGLRELDKDEAVRKWLLQTREGLSPHYSFIHSTPPMLFFL